MKSFSTISFAVCEVWKHQHEAHWLLNHKILKIGKRKEKKVLGEKCNPYVYISCYFLSFHSFYWSVMLYCKIYIRITKDLLLSQKDNFKPTLLNRVATKHMWPASTWNTASSTCWGWNTLDITNHIKCMTEINFICFFFTFHSRGRKMAALSSSTITVFTGVTQNVKKFSEGLKSAICWK